MCLYIFVGSFSVGLRRAKITGVRAKEGLCLSLFAIRPLAYREPYEGRGEAVCSNPLKKIRYTCIGNACITTALGWRQAVPRRAYDLGEEASWDGLDPEEVELHHRRLTAEPQPVFPVIDTCRCDNGGILPLDELLYLTDAAVDVLQNFIALVPAAGAASRFLRPLDKLTRLIRKGDYQAVRAELQHLKQAEMLRLPLFYSVRDMIKSGEDVEDATLDEERSSSLGLFPFPKAFHPCVLEDYSFFAFKVAEHRAIGALEKQAFIIPERSGRLFRSRSSAHCIYGDAMFFEQKGDLCTVRLLPDGKPYRDDNHCMSVVPAGHGVLTRLFPRIKAQVKAHSAFIRNIDNVMGGGEQPVEVCRSFLRLHHFIVTHVRKIRNALRREQLDRAEQLAHDIIISVLRRKPPANALWYVLQELFHSERPDADAATDRQNLLTLYARPVNTLGQVPNNGKDVGGTPVFAKWNGHRIKICLEIPHMREEDAANLNPEQATHFNPVFAACELDARYDTRTSPFWLGARKTFAGQQVMYHETLFSEVIGNSLHCNTLFVEVPRAIFNPHKCVTDAKDRHIDDWGFSHRDFPSW